MFWLVVALLFVAAYFVFGLLLALGFLVGAAIAGPLGKFMPKISRFSMNQRFWAGALIVGLVFYLFLGGAVAFGFLAGATISWIWG